MFCKVFGASRGGKIGSYFILADAWPYFEVAC